MEKYITVERAQELILGDCKGRLAAEKLDLLNALGRVLSEDVVAVDDIPPCDNSAMDGYGLRAAETAEALPEKPLCLSVAAEIPAGSCWDGSLPSGAVVRIMTGAPLPDGVDAVIRREQVEEKDDAIILSRVVPAGNDVRRAGEDVRDGQVVLAAGTRLTPAAVGMLAAVGRPFVEVVRRPRVAVLATGDEIVDFHEQPESGRIRNSNSYSMAALVRHLGCEAQIFPRLADHPGVIREALLAAASGSDLVLTSGGVSLGDYDYLQEVISALPDSEIRFWQVRMKPGKPLLYSVLKGTPVLGLPGNPVSTMVAFEIFARPLLLKMMGRPRSEWFLPRARAVLREDLKAAGDRRHYARGIYQRETDGALSVVSTGSQGSGILNSMVKGNCLIIQPAAAGRLAAGSPVEIEILDY